MATFMSAVASLEAAEALRAVARGLADANCEPSLRVGVGSGDMVREATNGSELLRPRPADCARRRSEDLLRSRTQQWVRSGCDQGRGGLALDAEHLRPEDDDAAITIDRHRPDG
jgi:hypothetical protein